MRHITIDCSDGSFADIGISEKGCVLWFELNSKTIYNIYLKKWNDPNWREKLQDLIRRNGLEFFGLNETFSEYLQ